MDFPQLYSGKLIKRYKRFLADIVLENSKALKEAHTRGVEILVYQSTITPHAININKKLDFTLA